MGDAIIGPAQAAALKSRYPAPTEAVAWSRIIFYRLGAVLFGLGVVSLFAYNWRQMPKFAKLEIIFAALIGVHGTGGWHRRSAGRYRAAGEGLHLLIRQKSPETALKTLLCKVISSGFLAVVPASKNANFIFLDLVDKPVFRVDAPGPTAGKLMLERFGLAGATKWITLELFDQLEDTQGFFAVSFHPPGKVFKPGRIKLQAFCRLRQKGCLSCGSWRSATAFSSLRF